MKRSLGLATRLNSPHPPVRPLLNPYLPKILPCQTNLIRWRVRCASTATETSTNTSTSETKLDPVEEVEINEPGTSGSSENNVSAADKAVLEKDREIAKLKDSLLRAVAEYENLQRTSAQERIKSKDFAIQNFARDLVADLDVLNLALNSVQPELLETQKELQTLWTGVEMTKKEIETTLKRYGVVPFNPTGEKFDPNLHEALYQAPIPGKEAGTVLECQKIGWMIKERLLRPAQVGVVLEAP